MKTIRVLCYVAFVAISYWIIDGYFETPLVEKNYPAGQIVRISIDGKEVPKSEWKKILKNKYEVMYVGGR